MQGWSLRLFRVFGVEVRLHLFFVSLLLPAMIWAVAAGGTALRGLVLLLLVLLAVMVRELARALATGWFGLELKSLLLLPTGGIATYNASEGLKRLREGRVQQVLALVGPLTSFGFGLALAGLALAVAPEVDLRSTPWVSPAHLVRAAVWVNLLLGALHLLPAWPLDAARVVQGQAIRANGGNLSVQALRRLGPLLAPGLIGLGLVAGNWWAIISGMAVLIGAQMEREGLQLAAAGTSGDGTLEDGAVRVEDVMLREYAVLSAGATLEDAVMHARETLQDVFPVVRGGYLVGAAGRAEIVQALGANGNGYVQGMMAKAFQTAEPRDGLVETLARVTGTPGMSSQLVPVLEGDRIVGIVTPENLQRSMRLVGGAGVRKQTRRPRGDEGGRD